jgi:hypothetical protein
VEGSVIGRTGGNLQAFASWELRKTTKSRSEGDGRRTDGASKPL